MLVGTPPPSRSTRLLVNFGNHLQLGICTAGGVDLLKAKYETNANEYNKASMIHHHDSENMKCPGDLSEFCTVYFV